jgi:hypothetical protein
VNSATQRAVLDTLEEYGLLSHTELEKGSSVDELGRLNKSLGQCVATIRHSFLRAMPDEATLSLSQCGH